MDAETRRGLQQLEGKLLELSARVGPSLVRPAGSGGGGGSASLNVVGVAELPEIPTTSFRVVALTGDTVYWAVPGDTNWHPLGGKFGLTDGMPGAVAP